MTENNNKFNNIALIGFMGCGKSAVGHAVAEKLGFDFIDCDAKIIEKEGMDIPHIFEQYGEDYFRALEKNVILTVSQSEKSVISTGGGCVKTKENIMNLKKSGFIIYLKADPQKIYDNIKDDHSRPLLNNTPDKLSTITAMLSERDPVYIKGADIVINVTEKTIEQAAEAVIKALKNRSDTYEEN
jgi:shikimate kinase